MEDERDKFQSFLPSSTKQAQSPSQKFRASGDNSVDQVESPEEFTRFHVLTCILGFLVLIFGTMITRSGMFINIRPFNCTEEESDDAIPSDLPWSEHQGFRSSVSYQYKLCLKATGDLTNMVFLVGSIVGSLAAGPTSDRFGRKPSILAGLVLTALTSLASNYAPSFWLHLVCRSLAGLCLIFAQSGVQVYGTEVVSQKHRGWYLASWSAGVSMGTLVSGVLAHLTRDHQIFTLVSCCVPAIPILLVICLPESPVWLAVRGRLDDSEAAFRRIDVINGRRQTRMIPEASLSPMNSSSISSGCFNGWNCRLVRLACLLSFHGVCTGLNCFGFFFVLSGIIPDVCLFAVLSGATMLPQSFLLSLVPRRPSLLASSILAGLITLGVGATMQFLPKNSSVTTGEIGGVLLAGLSVAGCFCSVAAFNLLLSVSAESFPTSIRNTGLGFCTFCLRCGSAVAPLINFLPVATVQSIVLGCPLLLSCLPLGFAICGCGRSCGGRFFISEDEEKNTVDPGESEKVPDVEFSSY